MNFIQTRLCLERNEGAKALADMEASRQKLVTFLDSVKKHQQKGQKLFNMMKHAQNSFNLQLRDVTVVNDVRFGFDNFPKFSFYRPMKNLPMEFVRPSNNSKLWKERVL